MTRFLLFATILVAAIVSIRLLPAQGQGGAIPGDAATANPSSDSGTGSPIGLECPPRTGTSGNLPRAGQGTKSRPGKSRIATANADDPSRSAQAALKGKYDAQERAVTELAGQMRDNPRGGVACSQRSYESLPSAFSCGRVNENALIEFVGNLNSQ